MEVPSAVPWSRFPNLVWDSFPDPRDQAKGQPMVLVFKGIWGFPKKRGPIFGSPYNKSPTILGYIVGPLIFGVSHMVR